MGGRFTGRWGVAANAVGHHERSGSTSMSERNTVVRSLNDLGLAAWFGGSLAGAVGFNGAAAEVPDAKLRLHVANAAWARWVPVNLVAVAAHLVGSAAVAYANKGRVVGQKGVGASSVAKTALTAAALAATGVAAPGAAPSARRRLLRLGRIGVVVEHELTAVERARVGIARLGARAPGGGVLVAPALHRARGGLGEPGVFRVADGHGVL